MSQYIGVLGDDVSMFLSFSRYILETEIIMAFTFGSGDVAGVGQGQLPRPKF